MKKILVGLLIAVCAATPVNAQCYSRAEAEAEQGLRIHSELMMIGLNCMGILGKPQLYNDYRKFTSANQDTIEGWERTMISYFSRNGGNGEAQFHDFRTRMANQVSANAARMRPDVFCHNTVARLNRAMGMSRADLLQWASMSGSQMPSKPLCAGTR